MLTVDNDVRVRGNGRLPRRARLPSIDATGTPFRPADAVGSAIRDHWPAAGAAWLAGVGVLAATRGKPATRRLGLAGLAAALGAGATAGVRRLVDSSRATADPRHAGDPKPRADHRVRVMTFNVHYAAGRDGRIANSTNMDAIAEAIRTQNPDVVLLQEVADFSVLSRFRDQLDELSERLGPDSAALATTGRRIGGTGKGNAIMTFNGFRIDDARNLRIDDLHGESLKRRAGGIVGLVRELRGSKPPETGWHTTYQPRGAIDAIVSTPDGNPMRVVSTHLSGTGRGSGGNTTTSQARQLMPLIEAIGGFDGPTIVGGDFNVPSSTAQGAIERRAFATIGMDDSFVRAGIPPADRRRTSYPYRHEGSKPGSGKDIDRIYTSTAVDVDDVRVVSSDRSSDHLPVVADLRLSPPLEGRARQGDVAPR